MTEKNFYTLNNRIVVENVSDDEISKGGVYVKHDIKNPGQPAVSKIVFCPTPDNVLDSFGFQELDGGIENYELKVGDEVLFYRHAAEEIFIHDKKYLILSFKAIIGVYK